MRALVWARIDLMVVVAAAMVVLYFFLLSAVGGSMMVDGCGGNPFFRFANLRLQMGGKVPRTQTNIKDAKAAPHLSN